ncbi:MAG TPA: BMP family ABC transporter substrate-binding protein [Devosia sp.]|nr:BMP family ABC transporter substrate-binding protein [Devosia sp.]
MSVLSSISKAAAGLVLAAGLTAAAVPAAAAADYSKDNPLKVVLVLHGNLGDKSFFDSAAAGLHQAEKDLPITLKIIEAGYDKSKWQPALADATDGDYDVVIAGTFDMTPFVSDLAPQYPDKKFIIFDDAPDYSKCDCKNVLGINYRTSSAGYLAGYAAASISKSGVLGTIVGMDFPTVTDFKVGFDQGAKAAKADIKILNEVAGTFSDPAKGKEIALAQLGQGADIIFPIAGATGIGALQAVRDAGGGKLAVGVDSDQYAIFKDSDPAQAAVIFTSVEKKVGQSLYLALKATIEGKQEYGKGELLGLSEGAVGISKNENYQKIVPADLQAKIDDLEKQIDAGGIKVDTVMK